MAVGGSSELHGQMSNVNPLRWELVQLELVDGGWWSQWVTTTCVEIKSTKVRARIQWTVWKVPNLNRLRWDPFQFKHKDGGWQINHLHELLLELVK